MAFDVYFQDCNETIRIKELLEGTLIKIGNLILPLRWKWPRCWRRSCKRLWSHPPTLRQEATHSIAHLSHSLYFWPRNSFWRNAELIMPSSDTFIYRPIRDKGGGEFIKTLHIFVCSIEYNIIQFWGVEKAFLKCCKEALFFSQVGQDPMSTLEKADWSGLFSKFSVLV